MKIYVDFDRTLFDCDRFLEDFYNLINKYNIPKNIFKDCQNQTKRHGFNPVIILNEVSKYCEFDKKIYQEIDLLISRTSDYLFLDTIDFLNYLKEKNYQVNILTRGNSSYQREKIFNSHLDKYYDKLIVTMRHKGNLNIDYQNSIFIDDNVKEIESILEKKPSKVIYINNKKNLGNIAFLNSVFEVSSLSEIIEKRII